MNARTAAIARESREIDESRSRAIAARQIEDARPRSAIEMMAARLSLSPDVLKNTLMKTAFKGCNSPEEFVALVAVANEYQLNPLLKEIYAFPAKGGGIVPMVGYDGWVKLMNSHPQFDGIEYTDHLDTKGNLYGIEVTIWRKDRSHPIKLMELLDECRRGTEPWKLMPSRMLRNRVTCQGARLAFGFTGIASDGDEDVIDGGIVTAQSLPTSEELAREAPRQTTAEALGDEIPAFDKDTGEIANDGTLAADNPAAAEGPADEQRGEPEQEAERGPWADNVDQILADVAAAKSRDALKAVEQDFLRLCGAWPKEVADQVEAKIAAKRKEV